MRIGRSALRGRRVERLLEIIPERRIAGEVGEGHDRQPGLGIDPEGRAVDAAPAERAAAARRLRGGGIDDHGEAETEAPTGAEERTFEIADLVLVQCARGGGLE